MKNKLTILAVSVFFFTFFVTASFAQGKVFTVEELSQYSGKNGAKAYTSYNGTVYDVTGSKLWELGEHFGLQAGKDLTQDMKNAPHGPEVFAGFTVVGTLEGYPTAQVETTSSERIDRTEATTASVTSVTDETQLKSEIDQPWYAKRIRIMGISILGWTGVILGVFFVLTFATCFALPWAKLPLPWKGSKIGPDPLDDSGTHMVWSSIHKYFVWVTVIVGIIHGILGFLQMLGIFL